MSLPGRPSFWTRQRVPTSELRFRDLAGETRWLLAFALLYVFAAAGTGLAIQRWPVPIWGATWFHQSVWYTGVFKIGLLLFLPALAFHRRGYRFADLLHGWRFGPRTAIVLALCFAGGGLLNTGRVAEVREAWAAHPWPEAAARAAVGVLLAFVQAGLPEEVVYRGLLQTRLEAAWGRLPAVLVATLLFTAWHLPTRFLLSHGAEGEAYDFGSVLLRTGVPVFIVGCVFAWAWDRHRNLPALIVLHAGIDTLPIVASLLQSPAINGR